MKTSAGFLGATVALTLGFYLLAYFLLPPPPPSAAMVSLFAGIALAVVAGIHALRKKKAVPKGSKSIAILALSLAAIPWLTSCKSAPPPVASGAPPSAARVTGTALLAAGQTEEPGFGLYSYALLARSPGESEIPRVKAFFRALLQLPTATALGQYVPRERINVTYIPLAQTAPDWGSMDLEPRVDWVLKHYDYARSTVILSGLGRRTGTGPVIVSALSPMASGASPHPVLVQDLTAAQPTLMSTYVGQFVQQAGQDHFWEPNALSSFALTMRNILEVAAGGVGMSKDAVATWVKFLK